MSSPDDPDWAWFPNVKSAWSLDVVNLLVVIGESSIAEHAQTITASLPGMLPRILPAPQALLKPSRPTRMPETHARMTGVYSGTTLDTVGFFANIITPLDTLPPFSFKVLDIEHSDRATAKRVPSSSRTSLPTLARIWRLVKRTTAGSRRRHADDDDDDDKENTGDGRRRMGQWEGESSGSAGGARINSHDSKSQRDEESGCHLAAGFPNQHVHAMSDVAASPASPPAAAAAAAAAEVTSTTTRRQPTVHFNDQGDSSTTTADAIGTVPAAPRRRETARERAQDLLTSPTVAVDGSRPAVPAKLFSPVHILSILSCLLSMAIIATAVARRDGTAILAISLISTASTIVGCASFWRPILMKRKHTNEVPRGDVLIRTREGALVLVRCSEEVARELFSGTEECEYYVGGNAHRALMALGTMLLMVSVVLLGNCTWELKVLIGTSYIVLNGLYWALGMIPRSYFWDLSRYRWADVTPADAAAAHAITQPADQREGHPSFTRTLWYAIRETRRTGWVERSGAAPSTDQWRKWLHEADEAARRGDRTWPAVQRKNVIMKEKLDETHVPDHAAQHAPVM